MTVETPAPPVASSPEALDDLVRTTTTRGWIALAAAAAVVAIGIIWSFTATIPSQTNATAVVYEPDAIHRVVAGTAGAVELRATAGDTVAAGQTIGQVKPYDSSPPHPITAPIAGILGGVTVASGTGVEPSTVVATITPPPPGASSVRLVTFLVSSDAVLYTPGQTVMVTLSDLATSDTRVLPATVTSVANVPADLASMQHTLQDDSLASQQLRDANGVAYRVELELGGLDVLAPTDRPASGQLVEVTNTYATQHPVELLFGST